MKHIGSSRILTITVSPETAAYTQGNFDINGSNNFAVTVSGFASAPSPDTVTLSLGNTSGLGFSGHDRAVVSRNSMIFTITVEGTGALAFANNISINIVANANYNARAVSKMVYYGNGSAELPFPVTRRNIGGFNDYAGKKPGLFQHYRQVENIILDKNNINNWTAIGATAAAMFFGSYDGCSFTITNLNIIKPHENLQGMFGSVGNEGKVMNVNLVEAKISGAADVGGIAGTIASADVIIGNCSVSGDVAGCEYVGGVVGWNSQGIVQSCCNKGDVSGLQYVGGVAGDNSGTVLDCSNTGDVSSTGNDVGGVVGRNYLGTVEICNNTGDVNSLSGNADGVVGRNELGTVRNCYSTGDVRSERFRVVKKIYPNTISQGRLYK
jgi:hypothetical protein